MSHKEKVAHLDAKIKKAQEEGNEEEYKYLQKIKEMTVNVYEGGVVIFQSGTPPKY